MIDGGTAIADKIKPFDKVISSLRVEAGGIEDFELAVRCLAVIAGVTCDRADISRAKEKIDEGGKYFRSKILPLLISALARNGHLKEARNIAGEMRGLDTFWVTIAWAFIARYSGEESDKQRVQVAFSNINTPEARNWATADCKFLAVKHIHVGKSKDKHLADLRILLRIVRELRGVEDIHKVPISRTSASLYYLVVEVTSRFFNESMRG